MSSINNVERFRARLEAGQICVGGAVTLVDPLVSEVAAQAGNDFVWIETEHSHLNLPAVMAHILALRGTQAAPIVRVPWNDPVLLKPVLDMAPAGVVIPMVRSAEEARNAVAACRYPPQGNRGFGPIRNMYGMESVAEYLEQADAQILIFIQIEHIDAVRDLDEILATPGLDGIVLGRMDLSGSMGKLGQSDDPEVVEAIDTIFSKTKQAGRYIGVSIGYDPDTVREWRAKGVDWFELGEEKDHFYQGAKVIAEAVHALDNKG